MSAEETLHAFQRMVEHEDAFPVEAYLFVRDGLHAAAATWHGEESPAHAVLQQFVHQHGLDWNQLQVRYDEGALPENIAALIREAGGCAKFNRHVTGAQLCIALRDLAISRWGLLARTVLETWGIHCTHDFGRIVFAFIENGLMQKQASDSLADFADVYRFDEAFPSAKSS